MSRECLWEALISLGHKGRQGPRVSVHHIFSKHMHAPNTEITVQKLQRYLLHTKIYSNIIT